MTLNDLEIEKWQGFGEFFTILNCDAHLKSEFSPKLLEIDQDNLMLSCVS